VPFVGKRRRVVGAGSCRARPPRNDDAAYADRKEGTPGGGPYGFVVPCAGSCRARPACNDDAAQMHSVVIHSVVTHSVCR
jgi:hypothetical protein